MKIGKDVIVGIDPAEESHFVRTGCENCNNKLGHSVYETKCYTETFDFYTVNLCSDCLMAYHYAEPLDISCENIFEI